MWELIFLTWKALLRTIFLNVCRSIFQSFPSLIACKLLPWAKATQTMALLIMAAQCSSSTWMVAALGWLYSKASSPKLPSPLYSKTFKRRKIRFLIKMIPSTVAHSHWSWWERDRRLRRQRRRSLRPRPARQKAHRLATSPIREVFQKQIVFVNSTNLWTNIETTMLTASAPCELTCSITTSPGATSCSNMASITLKTQVTEKSDSRW